MNKVFSRWVGASVIASVALTLAPNEAQAQGGSPSTTQNSCQGGGITSGFTLISGGSECYGAISDANHSTSDLNNGIDTNGSQNPIPSTGAWGKQDWSQLAKFDIDDNKQEGSGTLTIGGSDKSGNWSYDSFTSGNLYALVVKGATAWSAYGFVANSTSGSGTWDTELAGLVNNGGKTPALSNFAIYESAQTSTTPVPEPFTILGSGVALGFGAFMKRKMNQAKP